MTGTPKLTLGTAPTRTADFAGGSGSSTLTFDYTVQAGDTAADLDYASTGALALNGGTIVDVASNAAGLTLPAVGGPSSLGGQKSIVIDTTAPAVTSRSVSDSTLDIAYGEPIAGSPAPSDFAVLVNGASDAVDSVSINAGNTVRLALHTPVHHLDVVAVTYSGSSIADAAGNAAATFTGAAATNSTADVAPNAPTLSGPADGAFVGTTTPTLSAVFDDPDSQDAGKVVFEVCANSSCSSSLGTVDSSSTTLAVGQLGSAAVPGSFSLQTATQYLVARKGRRRLECGLPASGRRGRSPWTRRPRRFRRPRRQGRTAASNSTTARATRSG